MGEGESEKKREKGTIPKNKSDWEPVWRAASIEAAFHLLQKKEKRLSDQKVWSSGSDQAVVSAMVVMIPFQRDRGMMKVEPNTWRIISWPPWKGEERIGGTGRSVGTLRIEQALSNGYGGEESATIVKKTKSQKANSGKKKS